MKLLNIFFAISISFLFANCRIGNINTKNTRNFQCSILDSILMNKDISEITGLDKARNSSPRIRFFCDKSKAFSNCNGIHFTKNKTPIEYFIIPKISYYLNTGQYRDLVIYNYKENKKEIYISLIVAHFENQLEKEGVPFFEFTFKKDESGFKLDKVSITAIREKLDVSYKYYFR